MWNTVQTKFFQLAPYAGASNDFEREADFSIYEVYSRIRLGSIDPLFGLGHENDL